MFIPLGDDLPRTRTPLVTYVLIALNLLVFFLFCFPRPREPVMISYALTPDSLRWPQLLTAMFLHANLMHVLGNMLFLWIFGSRVELRLGRVGFLLFYLVSGMAAWFLHIVTILDPSIPALGASGAVSGTVGAYLVLYPRVRIRLFVWIYIFADVILVPAFLFIGLWFLEQVYFSSLGFGGVAYMAHVGGFAAGAAVGGLVLLVDHLYGSKPPGPVEFVDAAPPAVARRPFSPVSGEADIEFLDETFDRYSVVTLEDAAARAAEIAAAASPLSKQPAETILARLESTRGVVARGLPRADAEQLRRDLFARGVPAALVADSPGNQPPIPAKVDSASWDDRVLRLRSENQIVPIPWTAPFLFVGAAAGGETFIDVFPGGRTAFRIAERPGVPFTRVDASKRSEEASDLAGLARFLLEVRKGAGCTEGVKVLAQSGALGRLAFRSSADYDDYLFWTYNLARFHTSNPGG